MGQLTGPGLQLTNAAPEAFVSAVRLSDLSRVKGDAEGADSDVKPVNKSESGDGD